MVRYNLTDIGDVHPPIPGIHVPVDPVTDERDFGEETNDEPESEDSGDHNRGDQVLHKAV